MVTRTRRNRPLEWSRCERQLEESLDLIEHSLDLLLGRRGFFKKRKRRSAAEAALGALHTLRQDLGTNPSTSALVELPPAIKKSILAVVDPVEHLLNQWDSMDHDSRIEHILQATSSASMLRSSVDRLRAAAPEHELSIRNDVDLSEIVSIGDRLVSI